MANNARMVAATIVFISVVLAAFCGWWAVILPASYTVFLAWQYWGNRQQFDLLLNQCANLFEELMAAAPEAERRRQIAQVVEAMNSRNLEERNAWLTQRIAQLHEVAWFTSPQIHVASTKAIFEHARPLSRSLCLLFEKMHPVDLARRRQRYMDRLDAGLDALGQAAVVPELSTQVAAIQSLQRRGAHV